MALYRKHCLCRWNVSVLALQMGVIAAGPHWGGGHEEQAEPYWGSWENLGCGGLGRLLHVTQGFCGAMDVLRCPHYCITGWVWCVIMKWDAQSARQWEEGRIFQKEKAIFYNRLEATESKKSFINCRIQWKAEEDRAGIGVASPALFKNLGTVLGQLEDSCGF